MSRNARVVVVGGGISGLAAAHRLLELAVERDEALQIELLEAAPRLGGSIASESVGDYPVVEHGADMFITDKAHALDLCVRLGLDGELVGPLAERRRSLVLRDGLLFAVPDGFALMAPTAAWPMLKTPLLSWRGKARLFAEPLVPRRDEPGDESIASFIRRRFGSELYERLVQPLVGGIYTGDPERLSLAATLPRFLEMERRHRSVALASLRAGRSHGQPRASGAGARYGLFVSLARGLGSLIARLAERVRAGARVTLGARAVGLSRRAGAWNIECSFAPAGEACTNRTIVADQLIVALPAHAAAELLTVESAALAAELSAIPYASTAVVVTGHALADIANPLDGFGLVVPQAERRNLLAVSFASRKLAGRAPPARVQLRSFVGGALQPEKYELSDERLEALVLSELAALLGARGTPDFVRVVRHPRSMPQYLVGHLERVATLERLAGALPGLQLCGNGYRGVGIPDCVRSGEQAAEAVFARLGGTAQLANQAQPE